MNITKQILDLNPRPKLRLAEIERLIRKHRIIVPTPSRRALIIFCENGTLETSPKRDGQSWLVYEDSFLQWIEGLDKAETQQ